MKKLIIAIAAVAMAIASQAASTDWKLSVVNNSYNGWTVYIVPGSTAATSFSTLAALQQAAAEGTGLVSGTMSKAASGTSKDSAFVAGADNKSGSANYYFVLVDSAGEHYAIGSSPVSTALVYDTTKQQSSGGTVTTTFANASFGAVKEFGGGGDVPEPTSAMLLLLGVAGLALRRRQA